MGLPIQDLLCWSPWQSLEGSWRGGGVPRTPGLYRIRRVGHAGLDYIGQTGAGQMHLKARLGMLAGIYGPEMPYRDPHTAGPALWALRHSLDCRFEVSVLPVEGSSQWRKGLEAAAIGLHRQEHGRSPTVNFGRMPPGYRMSSGNNARLVAAGLRFRGGPTPAEEPCHLPGIAPIGPLTGDPQGETWGGHLWSAWLALSAAFQHLDHAVTGLYRIRRRGETGLRYIGEGRIAPRLEAHRRKGLGGTGAQALLFRDPETLACSWISNPLWVTHQRLELENDLIAAHLLETGSVPPAQFLGSSA